MKKLTELTDKQIERMKEFAKERIAIQLNTISTPELEKEAEENLRQAYKVAGLDSNIKIVWFDSPIQGMKYLYGDSVRASVWASVWDSVGDSVWDSVRASVRDSVWASVWDSVWDSVGDSVWDSVRASVRDSVWASVRASVRDSVRDSVWDSVGDSVWDSVGDSVRDSVRSYDWANVTAFYGFFNEILEPNNLRWLDRTNQLVSGYHLYSKEAILIRKPRLLTLDESGKLHNEVQKCMEYRDGFGFYAWHGTRVPEEIITCEVTKERVLSEQNQENKRVLIERVGWEKFLEWIDVETLHIDGDYKLLHSKEIVDEEELYLLQMKDTSTERQYILRMPPTVKTCRQAVAWSFNLEESNYLPEMES